MATISPTDRKSFLAKLTADQKTAFVKLKELLGDEQEDFAWHHEVGRCVQMICPLEADSENLGYGDRRIEKLARLLKCTPAPLRKKLRFAREYGQGEVNRLDNWQRRGLTWTHLTHAFTEQDLAKRWKLLEQAVDQEWNSERLKYEVRNKVDSSHPVGGRLPRKPTKQGHAVEMKRLQQLSQKWLNYHDYVWADEVTGSVFARLRELPRNKRKALTASLADTQAVLERLAKAARHLQQSLAKLGNP